MIDGPYEWHPVYYRKRAKGGRLWHTVAIPGVDPKLTVVDRTQDAALRRAEQLFGVFIPAAVPPVTLLPPPETPHTPEAA